MTSAVSLRSFANFSHVPIVVFVDMQQEYLAKPRLLAISKTDRVLENCRRMLNHSRQIGLPVAFIRMLNGFAFFNRATPFVQRAVSRISALYGDVYETADRIASTLPRKLGNGRNAGG